MQLRDDIAKTRTRYELLVPPARTLGGHLMQDPTLDSSASDWNKFKLPVQL